MDPLQPELYLSPLGDQTSDYLHPRELWQRLETCRWNDSSKWLSSRSSSWEASNRTSDYSKHKAIMEILKITTPKNWTCPLKRGHFTRICHLPTINFQGQTVSSNCFHGFSVDQLVSSQASPPATTCNCVKAMAAKPTAAKPRRSGVVDLVIWPWNKPPPNPGVANNIYIDPWVPSVASFTKSYRGTNLQEIQRIQIQWEIAVVHRFSRGSKFPKHFPKVKSRWLGFWKSSDPWC